MLMLNQLVGFGGKKAAVITLTFIGNTIDSGIGPTYTFSGHAIGTAADNRQVVVAVVSGSNASRTINSVSVGGTALTEIIEALGGTVLPIALYAGAIPTGATADIVVTMSGSEDALQVGVWAMYGAAVGASATATNEDTPPAAAIAIPGGGVAIGASNNVGTAGVTWTGATERYDEQVETGGGNVWGSGADNTTGGGTTPTITADQTTESSPVLVLAAWAP